MAIPVHPYSDYGVALRTLKSARGWLSILLFLCIATQFIGFALLYWTRQPYEAMTPRFTPATGLDKLANNVHPGELQTSPGEVPAIQWSPKTPEGSNLNVRNQWDKTYLICVPATQLLGLISVCSMTLLIFITLQVTLVAHAPGIAHMTRSLIWSVLLLFMVFPWQYFFAHDFYVPGLFYGHHELLNSVGPFVVPNYKTPGGDIVTIYPFQRFLVIARFVFWPIIGMIVMVISAERFRAGIMLAIGHPLQTMMQPRPQPAGPIKPVAPPSPVARRS